MSSDERPNRILLTSLALAALGLAPACHPIAGMSPTAPSVEPATHPATLLSGRVEFPDRTIQQTTGGLVSLATVTLYNAANQAVAVGKTDASGNFTLDPGLGFSPAAGDTFVLDAYKTPTTNGVGSDVARLRTVVAWGGSAWNSVSGSPIQISAATTAVCVIQGLNAGTMPIKDTLNAVSGASITGAPFVWSGPTVTTLITDLLAKDQDPLARITYASGRYIAVPDAAAVLKLERFLDGSFTDTTTDAAGTLQLGGPKPQPRNMGSELAYFQCQNMNNDGAGVVTTDGTYLYVKAWSDYASSSVNSWVLKKIGTGFGGTTRGQNYGMFGTSTTAASTMVYWNGGVYMRTGTANQLLRVDAVTGAQTVLTTTATTLDRYTGRPGVMDLLACDGTFFYNLSYGIEARTPNDFNGWTVQVLNPANNFSLVRQFNLEGPSYYTDGVFCDGTYLYPIEWIENGSSRLRRYRLSDGKLEAESLFAQTYYSRTYNAAANDPISGSWDPVNKVFWIGNLTNDWVHLLRGGNFHTGGTYTSAPLDAQSGTPYYGRLNWTATLPASTSLTVKVRSANTLADLGAAAWYGPTSVSDAYSASGTLLNPIHQKQRYLQVQATLSTSDTMQTPKLQTLGVEVLP